MKIQLIEIQMVLISQDGVVNNEYAIYARRI